MARRELAASVRDRPPGLARDLVRAFSTWFQVVESSGAGPPHSRRRDYFVKDGTARNQGVEDAIAALKSQGHEPQRRAQAARHPAHRAGLRRALDGVDAQNRIATNGNASRN